MSMTPDHHLETVRELADVQAALKGVLHNVEEVARRMELIGHMQQDITRLQQQQIETTASLKRAFERMEKRDEDDDERMENMLETRALTERWVNRGLGAWFIGAILFMVIQALVIDRVKSYQDTQTAQAETLVTVDRRLAWVEYELKRWQRTDQPK
jgi:hypothetical protein